MWQSSDNYDDNPGIRPFVSPFETVLRLRERAETKSRRSERDECRMPCRPASSPYAKSTMNCVLWKRTTCVVKPEFVDFAFPKATSRLPLKIPLLYLLLKSPLFSTFSSNTPPSQYPMSSVFSIAADLSRWSLCDHICPECGITHIRAVWTDGSILPMSLGSVRWLRTPPFPTIYYTRLNRNDGGFSLANMEDMLKHITNNESESKAVISYLNQQSYSHRSYRVRRFAFTARDLPLACMVVSHRTNQKATDRSFRHFSKHSDAETQEISIRFVATTVQEASSSTHEGICVGRYASASTLDNILYTPEPGEGRNITRLRTALWQHHDLVAATIRVLTDTTVDSDWEVVTDEKGRLSLVHKTLEEGWVIPP